LVEAASNKGSVRILEITSFRSFLQSIVYLNSVSNFTVIMENIAMAVVLPFVLRQQNWILDYHGSVYDASFKRFFWFRKRVLLYLEGLAASRGRLIVVSNAFRLMLERVHPRCEIFVLPNIPVGSLPSEKHKINDRLELVYAGGIQSWQMIPELLNFVNTLGNFYEGDVHWKILTGDQEGFYEMLESKNNWSFSYSVKTVTSDKVLDEVELSDFALMLREENWINRVACPTKAVEYLKTSTPLIVSNNLGDITNIVHEYKKGVVLSEDWRNQENLKNIINYHQLESRRFIELKEFSDVVYDEFIEFL
jgi:hypothetical protein